MNYRVDQCASVSNEKARKTVDYKNFTSKKTKSSCKLNRNTAASQRDNG